MGLEGRTHNRHLTRCLFMYKVGRRQKEAWESWFSYLRSHQCQDLVNLVLWMPIDAVSHLFFLENQWKERPWQHGSEVWSAINSGSIARRGRGVVDPCEDRRLPLPCPPFGPFRLTETNPPPSLRLPCPLPNATNNSTPRSPLVVLLIYRRPFLPV